MILNIIQVPISTHVFPPQISFLMWEEPGKYCNVEVFTGKSLPRTGHAKHAFLAYRLFAKAAHGHDGHQKTDENAGAHEHHGDLPHGREHR